MSTDTTKPRRRGTPEDADELRMQLAVLRSAAGVPGELNDVEAVRFLSSISGKLDRVGALVLAWEPRAAQGVTLSPDYQRGCADAWRQALTELRAALGWPDKP